MLYSSIYTNMVLSISSLSIFYSCHYRRNNLTKIVTNKLDYDGLVILIGVVSL